MDNLTDDQLDEMLLDKRLEEARAAESEEPIDDSTPIEVPYAPGKQPSAERGYLESFGRGALQGYTSGFPDEITGAIESTFGDKPYKRAREESREEFRAAEKANPKTYGAGMIAGAIGQALTPGYNVVSKGGPLVQGAMFGLGASEGEGVGDIAKDVGLGAATGYGMGKAFDAAGKTKLAQYLGQKAKEKAASLGKSMSNVAEQRAYKAAAGQSIADLRKESEANRIIQDREGISIARGRDLLSEDEAGKPVVGWLSRTESIAPKAEEKREFFGKAIGNIGKSIDEATQGGASSYDEIAGIIDREMAKRPSTIENVELTKKLHRQLDHIFDVQIQDGEKIIGKPNIGFVDSQKYKSAFEWNPSKNISRPQDYDYETTLHNSFSEAMENAAERSKDLVPEAAKYPYYKGKYASYRGAAKQGEDRSLRNLSNRLVSPSDYAMGIAKGLAPISAGASAGYATTGDTLGALMGGAMTAFGHKQVRERGSAFAARSADLAARALDAGMLGKYSQILGQSLKRGAANFTLTHALLMKSDPEYQKAIADIEKEYAQPEATQVTPETIEQARNKPFAPGILAKRKLDDYLQENVVNPLHERGYTDTGAAIASIPSAIGEMMIPSSTSELESVVVPMPGLTKGIQKVQKANKDEMIEKFMRGMKNMDDVDIDRLRPDLYGKYQKDIQKAKRDEVLNYLKDKSSGSRKESQEVMDKSLKKLFGGDVYGNSSSNIYHLARQNTHIPEIKKYVNDIETLIYGEGDRSSPVKNLAAAKSLEEIQAKLAQSLLLNKDKLKFSDLEIEAMDKRKIKHIPWKGK